MELFEWQKESFDKWADAEFRGIIQAVTGAGKTVAACECIRKYRLAYPDSVIWVITDYKDLKEQWENEPNIFGISNIFFHLYLSSVNQYDRLTKLGRTEELPQLVILDECHHIGTGIMWGKIVHRDIPHILGLSATPGQVESLIGPIIQKIGYDQARIAPSETHLVKFTLSDSERLTYRAKCLSMDNYKKDHNPNATFQNDSIYMVLSLKRKEFVQRLFTRMNIAVSALKANPGKRAIVFFTRSKQVKAFAKMLDVEGIGYAIHISGRKELYKFKEHEVDVLLCINMVTTGFSDDSIDIGIVVAYNQSLRDNIQKVGRVLRYRDGKIAKIYYPVAMDTIDEEIVNNKSKLFPPGTVKVEIWNGKIEEE